MPRGDSGADASSGEACRGAESRRETPLPSSQRKHRNPPRKPGIDRLERTQHDVARDACMAWTGMHG